MNVMGNHAQSIEIRARAGLEALLKPAGLDQFMEQYFDRQPLHIEGQRGRFADLAEIASLRSLIDSGAPWQVRRLPELYLNGKRVRQEDLVSEYVDMDGYTAYAPRLERVARLLDAGATISCAGMESHFEPLRRLQRLFSHALRAEVIPLLFYSRQDHPGLSPHYDCVEIFVLQVCGSKRWHVSSQRASNPVSQAGEAIAYNASSSGVNIELHPGHMLYIPRGTFHYAEAISGESLHVTMAVRIPTYLDWIEALVSVAANSTELRGYAPLDMQLSVFSNSLAERARSGFIEAIAGQLATDEFIDELQTRHLVRLEAKEPSEASSSISTEVSR